MFRNAESHFAQVPGVEIQRSKMRIPHEHKTSFNVGDVIPIYYDGDILPGDSVKMTTSKVVRLQTMLTPIMDNMFLDIYWFFVPYRLVWNHWKEFMLENTASPWAQTTQYSIPTISAPASTGFAVGSLADYFGYPVGVTWSNTDINAPSALPFRVYAKIMDEFFRDENLTYPLNIPTGDSNQTGTNGNSYINDVANGGAPFKAARVHDYFSSCLPTAQKAAQPVTLPLAEGGLAPVAAINKNALEKFSATKTAFPVVSWSLNNNYNATNFNTNSLLYKNSNTDFDSAVNTSGIVTSPGGFRPANLWANLNDAIGTVTVNELRLAFQLQRFYERLARSGSRYTETIKAFFGVTSPDSRLQRPEYLGGNRISINVTEVTNSAQSTGEALGDLGAKSNTSDVHYDFDHSFTEHGALICLAVCRYSHSFSQGIEKQFLRKTFTDFYWPTFAHLGEMPVKTCQIYADGEMNSDDVFGYQEAWAEYRYKPNRVSGEMRPGIANSLASWNLSDYYTSAPTLSDGWIREPVSNVDRVLAVTSAVSNQLFGDFYFQGEYTRPMPVFSVPGLIDHF